jgi:hypothetical protein
MSTQRQPYIRPVVMRLEYTTDVRVSQVSGCKLETSDTGPSVTGCLTASPPIIPCSDPVS